MSRTAVGKSTRRTCADAKHREEPGRRGCGASASGRPSGVRWTETVVEPSASAR
uniref:Uncharacterized protein n=1 Tax=Arundo donax TaxID=35708 RepID=A0A0A9HAE5_ARUDO